MKLAKRLDVVKPSPTLAITAKAREMKSKGIDVVGFGAGEPDFDTPSMIKDAAKKAIDAGFTKYTPTNGIVELREAIAARIQQEHRVSYKASEVLVSCGGKHALYNLFQALLNDGDEVVIFTPYWVSYADMVRVAGGVPVLVETSMDTGFDPSPEQIRKAIGPRTRAVIVNSPSNPTGAMLSRRTLETVISCVKGTEILVVSDDIYDKLVYRGKFENVLDLDPSLQGQVALVNGASKTFSMTGWRIGWTAGPQALISAMQKLQDNSTSNPASISQKAALGALTAPGVGDEVEKMRRTFDERRKHIVGRLNAIDGVRCFDPGGAFYAFPYVGELLKRTAPGASAPLGTDDKLIDLLLEKHLVAAVPGSAFGAPGYMRLSFATSMEQIDKGCDRIAEMAKSLK
ncbi:aminotransferase class I and II [Anaeromyxobacter sp. K]|uniref:pyridoxal phosphate-dependent aminotransferase n=1 Tax=Anaeromyxobacter sp. (strain K) TaxID=447217 RepID=UPI00015F8403|nr:pyridoxal phosphate-dependent aminotransferase [Anaeromyxobacter sp. K]ACG73343.1 aminotransferase class I and II [Anaeromyxobacter sp. K]